MAIRCEFIAIIVPIANIDRVYPGGFAAFKEENASLFGGRLWHDDHLFRDGAMSPANATQAVDFWRHQGLEPIEMRDGRQVWKELCVVEHMFGGPTLPCDWLEFDRERACVYVKGTPSEPVVGREGFEGSGEWQRLSMIVCTSPLVEVGRPNKTLQPTNGAVRQFAKWLPRRSRLSSRTVMRSWSSAAPGL